MSVQVISFNCLLKNKAGQVISTTFNRDVLNSSTSEGVVLKGLAEGLQGLRKGERRSISLSAEEAYGLYDPKKVILFPKNKLPNNFKVGTSVTIRSKTGTMRTYKILQLMDSFAYLDGNHPLAGQDLIFEIEAISVRDASPEEIEDSISVVGNQILH
ncbi:hypothetical protein AZI86_00345 [Bdellovibrio bacteriovorus]|uniref:Peptidyl-prolyl cis-trans isomerase n=1 Tax=Bdellovibrio bacteriovorus TaxID=959 RepID=A0A150WMZ0_BDEBC|nr:FKBP-type peptidyl-prolyl cis-trans isomerase [Bdellovibrio bacteriovorus]KYG65565.1 hypothetical protein AZI86_00345 [Bdellovibrio bacteriovorus]